MPRYDDESMETFQMPGEYKFTGVSIKKLEATQYTLVTICVDSTPSVTHFRDLIINTIKKIVRGCLGNKVIVDIILIRVVYFNTKIGVKEFHGYKLLNDIDIDNDYENIEFAGFTNLYDATGEVIEANIKYAKTLKDGDYDNNSINFVLTDGMDNASDTTKMEIKQKLDEVKQKEITESILMILIGLNTDDQISNDLDSFKSAACLDKYIDAKDLTVEKVAQVSDFIVDQISSQSSSLGTGSPSQVLEFK